MRQKSESLIISNPALHKKVVYALELPFIPQEIPSLRLKHEIKGMKLYSERM